MCHLAFLRHGSLLTLTMLAVLGQVVMSIAATPIDQLADLTGRATAISTLKARDNFANQFDYTVTVRNLTSDPLEADSLIVVVDSITDLAGKDATDRIEVVGSDGMTNDGKPYYRVPAQGTGLAPYAESSPISVRLRNPYYTILFTPSFSVRGARALSPGGPDPSQALLDLLIKKGVLAESDRQAAEKAVRTP